MLYFYTSHLRRGEASFTADPPLLPPVPPPIVNDPAASLAYFNFRRRIEEATKIEKNSRGRNLNQNDQKAITCLCCCCLLQTVSEATIRKFIALNNLRPEFCFALLRMIARCYEVTLGGRYLTFLGGVA